MLMTKLILFCNEVMTLRLTWNFDRTILPDEWVYEDGTSNGPLGGDEERQRNDNKKIIAAMLQTL